MRAHCSRDAASAVVLLAEVMYAPVTRKFCVAERQKISLNMVITTGIRDVPLFSQATTEVLSMPARNLGKKRR